MSFYVLHQIFVKNTFCTLGAVKLGSWHVKVSTLVDQILIICLNINTNDIIIRMFYDEIEAFEFMETI
jgi:hypothetical protein